MPSWRLSRNLHRIERSVSVRLASSTSASDPPGKPSTAWDLHDRLERGVGVAGTYAGSHGAYHAVAEAQTGKRLTRLAGVQDEPKQGKVPEWYVPALDEHMRKPETQANWDKIVSFDPYGLWSSRPTISATTASMEIPEIMGHLHVDGKIVNADQSINCIKVAIEPVWSIPRLADRLKCDEKELRQALLRWTRIPEILDSDTQIFLPAIGGTTVYLFGDLAAINDPNRQVATRPHDECSGSDVFGTDICTCRPYLVYAIQAAVENAQRRGAGVIAYFRKEGRALGEVTKFRVYNSRRYQEGGDRPETYFQMTEQIAGLADARAQSLMPDVYHWLGISKIDTLLSMSKDKHDSIVHAGKIEVLNRVSLPEDMVPANAQVEISAKISSGYNAFQPKPDMQGEEDHSRSAVFALETIRSRSKIIYQAGLDNELRHFTVNLQKMDSAVGKVVNTIKSNYPELDVPLHSRMRHFETGSVNRVAEMSSKWTRFSVDSLEQTRRIVDLVVTSVLLDAGAGPSWRFLDHRGGGVALRRSEGLAVASLDMFRGGLFSSDPRHPYQVDSAALAKLTEKDLAIGFQVREDNPIVGLEGRLRILHRLASAMDQNPVIFGNSRGVFRPGNLVDHILRQSHSDDRFSIRVLWKSLMDGLLGVFPDNSGLGVGDAYRHYALDSSDGAFDDVVPFHKLSQWLAFSLVEPLQSLGIHFVDTWLLTGLPEYRNGGLFLDTGVLEPRDPRNVFAQPLAVNDPVVVEWRALTVALLDQTAVRIWDRLGTTERKFSMGQILEGGTWRAGRELAFEKRPSGDPPIILKSSGDVF